MQSIDNNSNVTETIKYAAPFSRTLKIFSTFRAASYFSDVGEATRGAVPIFFVRAMYGVTLSYIGSDLYFKYNENKTNPDIKQYMGYHTLWHSQASLIYPMVAIHSIVKITRNIIPKLSWIKPNIGKYVPAGIALVSIPLLIHPLDKLADVVMDKTYCRITGWKPPRPPCPPTNQFALINNKYNTNPKWSEAC